MLWMPDNEDKIDAVLAIKSEVCSSTNKMEYFSYKGDKHVVMHLKEGSFIVTILA